MTDGEWIDSNPERCFRLRPSNAGENAYSGGAYQISNLQPMTVVDISEDRKSWGTQSILVMGFLEDTESNAKRALKQWDRVLFPRLIELARHGAAQ